MKQHLAVVIAVLLVNLVAPGSSAVVRMNKRGVWHYPCGKSVTTVVESGKAVNPPRHEVTKLLKTIKTQFGVATKHFKKEEKNIKKIYAEVSSSDFNFQYDWLPQNQMLWYKNEIRCLKKDVRIKEVLRVFHSSLQNFSVTFQDLLNFGKPDIYPPSALRTRNRVIEEMAVELNQVLCEVDTALIILGHGTPERIGDDFLHSKTDKWSSKPDYTHSKVQDWGVISLYRKFLVDWYWIMDKVNKNAACKVDKGRRKKPKQ